MFEQNLVSLGSEGGDRHLKKAPSDSEECVQDEPGPAFATGPECRRHVIAEVD